jgi:hypothetical protein
VSTGHEVHTAPLATLLLSIWRSLIAYNYDLKTKNYYV